MVTKLHKGLRRSFSIIREVWSIFEEEERKKRGGKGVLKPPRRLHLGPDGMLGQNRRKNSSWHASAVGCALIVGR